VQLRQLVEHVDGAIDGDPPEELLAPCVRAVDELAAACSGRAARRTDPASTNWVLVQRAADHFGRSLVGSRAGQRAAPATAQAAVAAARRTAARHLGSSGPQRTPSAPRRHGLVVVVTPATLGRMTQAACAATGGRAGDPTTTDLVVLGLPAGPAACARLDAVAIETGITRADDARWWLAQRTAAQLGERLGGHTGTATSRAVPVQRLHVEALLETHGGRADRSTLLLPRARVGSLTWWRLRRLRRAARRRGGVDVLAI
jgi:hypothetical protein